MTNWQTKSFEELLNYEQPQKYLVSDTNYINEGTPVLTANKGFLLGYTDEQNGVYKASADRSVVIFDDFTCDSKFVDFNFKIKSSAIKLLTPKNGDSLQFIFWAMQNINTEIGEHKRHYLSEYQYNTVEMPSIEEQYLIVETIQDFDDYLEKVQEKLEATRQLKKGLSQQIFSGQIRFKDDNGQDFPDWKEKKLGEILIKNSTRNKNASVTNVQSVSNTYGFVNQGEYFEGRNIASKDLSNYFVITPRTFAYNPSRINVGSLAYKFDKEMSVISPLYISFKAKNEFLNDKFLLDWFFSDSFIRQMNNMFEGSVRNTLSYEALKVIKINLPSLPEQQKIANFLNNIDEIISSLEQLLEVAKNQKKWLLENLVTGKIRLKEFRDE